MNLEEAIREAVEAAKNLEREWHVDVVQSLDGAIRVRNPIYGPYESNAERAGLEKVLVSIEGWDSDAYVDYDAREMEEERYNAEMTLRDELIADALERAKKVHQGN